MYPSDVHMSYLPLAHMFERVVQVLYGPLVPVVNLSWSTVSINPNECQPFPFIAP